MVEHVSSANSVTESWIGRGSAALLRSGGHLEAGLLAVTSIGLCSAGLLPFSVLAGQWPGSDLVGILTIGMLFCLFHGYVYAAIGSAVSRPGADYVLASRVLSGPLAFAGSWTFVLFSGMAAGGWVAGIVQTTIRSFVRIFGLLLAIPEVSDQAQAFEQPAVLILLGTGIVLLAYFSQLTSPRTFFRVLWIGFGLAVAAWLIILVVLGAGSPQAFQEGWNQLMGANQYSQVIPAAQSLGMNLDPDSDRMILAGMAVGLWIFFGYFVPTFFSSEIKKPERNLLTGSWSGLLVAWAVLSGAAYLLGRVAPADWLAAQSFLSRSQNAMGPAQAWLPLYVLALAPSLPLALLLFLAWVYTSINLVQVVMAYISRILLAWADDGLLPSGMDYVHPRFRSPLLTLLVAAVLVQIGLVNALLGGFWGSQFSLPFMAAVTMIVPVTAITVFPYLKPEWYESSPGFVRAQILRFPLISLFGGIALFSLLWFIGSSLILRTSPDPLGWGDGLALVVFVASGLVWYAVRRYHLRAKGIRLENTFKYLP